MEMELVCYEVCPPYDLVKQIGIDRLRVTTKMLLICQDRGPPSSTVVMQEHKSEALTMRLKNDNGGNSQFIKHKIRL